MTETELDHYSAIPSPGGRNRFGPGNSSIHRTGRVAVAQLCAWPFGPLEADAAQAHRLFDMRPFTFDSFLGGRNRSLGSTK